MGDGGSIMGGKGTRMACIYTSRPQCAVERPSHPGPDPTQRVRANTAASPIDWRQVSASITSGDARSSLQVQSGVVVCHSPSGVHPASRKIHRLTEGWIPNARKWSRATEWRNEASRSGRPPGGGVRAADTSRACVEAPPTHRDSLTSPHEDEASGTWCCLEIDSQASQPCRSRGGVGCANTKGLSSRTESWESKRANGEARMPLSTQLATLPTISSNAMSVRTGRCVVTGGLRFLGDGVTDGVELNGAVPQLGRMECLPSKGTKGDWGMGGARRPSTTAGTQGQLGGYLAVGFSRMTRAERGRVAEGYCG